MLNGLLIPILILWLLLAVAWKRLPMYDLFVDGAEDGGLDAVAR